MNRTEYHELLQEIEAELREPGGNFDALFGHDEKTLAQARFAAAVALAAADRLYARLTRQAFALREQDEAGWLAHRQAMRTPLPAETQKTSAEENREEQTGHADQK